MIILGADYHHSFQQNRVTPVRQGSFKPRSRRTIPATPGIVNLLPPPGQSRGISLGY